MSETISLSYFKPTALGYLPPIAVKFLMTPAVAAPITLFTFYRAYYLESPPKVIPPP